MKLAFYLIPAFIATLVCLSPGSIAAQGAKDEEIIKSEKAKFRMETVADGLDHPWGMAKLPDGRFLVTERPGRLRVIDAKGDLLAEPVNGIPDVYARGQGGLMDIELHPDYAANGWIYLSYSDPKDRKAMTKIIRGRLKGNAFADQETIYEAPAGEYTSRNIHFGNRMEFDGKGFLYFTIGDRGDATTPANNAQKLTNPKGKVHRIHDDGRVPADNPFASQQGAARTIWSYGNRNAQGLKFQPGTDLLWETEHGPRGGDELNVIEKGKNYGWPVVTFGINYSGEPITDKTSAPGMESPVIHWTPSIAVAGIDFYTGDKFPAWKGNLLVTSLAHQKLIRLELKGRSVTHQEIVLQRKGRLRDVRCFDDGYIYLIFDDPGKIVRLAPAD